MLDALTQRHYRGLAAWMAGRRAGAGCPIIGINGAQGSGKSTAAVFLRDELLGAHHLRAAVVSLDDFYLPRAARQELAARVHPLFATRGVPGTHDVDLGIDTLRKLTRLGAHERLALPAFSKAEDDRRPPAEWPVQHGPVDLVLFEGWCVGTPHQTEAELSADENALEAYEDVDGRWRRLVNDHLRTSYAAWFSLLDARVFLAVPDIACVRRWRWQQEQGTARAEGGSGRHLLTREQIDRFIQHYERLTRHALKQMPSRADAVLTLRDDHTVGAARYRDTSMSQ